MATPRLPIPAVALSVLANLMLAAGLAGLFIPEKLPALAAPALAWTLVGVGAGIEIAALIGIVGAMRHQGWPRAES
jgi:hypothetical protein